MIRDGSGEVEDLQCPRPTSRNFTLITLRSREEVNFSGTGDKGTRQTPDPSSPVRSNPSIPVSKGYVGPSEDRGRVGINEDNHGFDFALLLFVEGSVRSESES